jgi:hypothetical protein
VPAGVGENAGSDVFAHATEVMRPCHAREETTLCGA